MPLAPHRKKAVRDENGKRNKKETAEMTMTQKKAQQSTKYVLKATINQLWLIVASSGIGKPPDALEWPEPAMVGLSKKLAC